MGLPTSGYNVTDISPELEFERHVYHRDMFAHYLRWSHILKVIKPHERVVDFGCGQGDLIEVLYRNRHIPSAYFGFDVRTRTVEKLAEKYKKNDWARFFNVDLVKAVPQTFVDMNMNADHVVSFEVVEHIGQTNIHRYLENFKACGNAEATYYLSTPNYDPSVGAAGNHTYDALDGRGVQPQEFEHWELSRILQEHFKIERKYGTFASIRDYKPLLDEAQLRLFNKLSEYYDTNVLAVIFAPLFPEKARNCIWIMRRKTGREVASGL